MGLGLLEAARRGLEITATVAATGFLPVLRQESGGGVQQTHLGELPLVLKFALISFAVLLWSLPRNDSGWRHLKGFAWKSEPRRVYLMLS